MGKSFNIAYMSGHKSNGYPVSLQNGVRNAIAEQGHNLIQVADAMLYANKRRRKQGSLVLSENEVIG